MEDSTLKACSCCGIEKPHILEIFAKKKGVTSGTCRACISDKQRAWRAANADYVKARNKENYWKDKEARLAKQHTQYWADPEAARAKARARQPQRRITHRNWVKANPERSKVHRERYLALHKAVALAGVRRWRAANRERVSFLNQRWQKANPDRVKELHRERRARRTGAEGKHTMADIRAKLRSQKSKCYWCKAALILDGEGKYHVDHVIPLSKGGSDGPENIACACPSCNLKKNNKMPWEFAGRLF